MTIRNKGTGADTVLNFKRTVEISVITSGYTRSDTSFTNKEGHYVIASSSGQTTLTITGMDLLKQTQIPEGSYASTYVRLYKITSATASLSTGYPYYQWIEFAIV